MTILFRRGACLLLCLCALLAAVPARAAQTDDEKMAENISGISLIADQEGFSAAGVLFDGNTIHAKTYADHSWMTLEYPEGIGSLYLIFDLEYGAYTVTDNDTGETAVWGENGFLHEFVDLEAAFGHAPTSVTLSFDGGSVALNELYVFTSGQTPDFVQHWSVPAEGETDLVLFSTHGDDEQLFFAGILPYYAGELGYQVQVVYLTNHRNRTTQRCHEMLNGLWAVGVTAYPVFGEFGDYLTNSLENAYGQMRYMNISEETLVGFVVEQLRRFKPLVAVGHDINGEYGHGQHMLYTDMLMKAVAISADPQQYPELAEEYGVWDVPKTYLHLYPENGITLDWDQPLSHFDGMTAYQVTKKLGFPCHESQYTDFAWYFAGRDTAAQIPMYSPCEYGLYRTTVGQDVEKNDFFENLTVYSEQKRLAEEEAAREAALRAEEEARLQAEEESRQAEEAVKAAAEEATPPETLPAEQEDPPARSSQMPLYLCAGVVLLVALAAVIARLDRKSEKGKKDDLN